MTNKRCEICKEFLLDGDPIVAHVISRFHTIPSNRSFSIEKPIMCICAVHVACEFPEGEFEDAYEEKPND